MSLEAVLSISGGVIVLLLTIVGWLFSNKMNGIEDRIKANENKNSEIEKKQNEIQFNYLSRFDEIKTTINENHLEQMKAITAIQTSCRFCSEEGN